MGHSSPPGLHQREGERRGEAEQIEEKKLSCLIPTLQK